MKLALDTNVLVAGLRSAHGASRRLLVLLHAGRFEAIASIAMMLEYEAVLKRKSNLTAANLTTQEIDIFLDGLASMVTPVLPFYLWRPALRDPADEHVLEAAINGNADAIITFNVKDFYPASEVFGLEIMKPVDALRRLGSWQI